MVDFMVSPSFIKNNFDKFTDFIMLSLKMGVFEMQLNVVSSETLIKAKANPDAYPNLIVRVWVLVHTLEIFRKTIRMF